MINWVLRNPFYYGMMRIKNELYPHKYEPLISKELFDRVQQVRTGYHKKPFKYASKPFIFRGLIKCADCGCTITPEIKKGKYHYYSCTNYKRTHKRRIYLKEEELLAPVYKILKGIKLSNKKVKDITDGLRKLNESKNQFNKQAIAGLREEYDKYEKRISNMTDDRFDGCITTEMFNQKLKEYKEKQQEILEKLKRHDSADKDYYITLNTTLSLAQRAYEIFESSEVSEKRQFLNFLLQNCELKGKKLLFSLKAPFDTMLQANKCSNLLRG